MDAGLDCRGAPPSPPPFPRTGRAGGPRRVRSSAEALHHADAADPPFQSSERTTTRLVTKARKPSGSKSTYDRTPRCTNGRTRKWSSGYKARARNARCAGGIPQHRSVTSKSKPANRCCIQPGGRKPARPEGGAEGSRCSQTMKEAMHLLACFGISDVWRFRRAL